MYIKIIGKKRFDTTSFDLSNQNSVKVSKVFESESIPTSSYLFKYILTTNLTYISR